MGCFFQRVSELGVEVMTSVRCLLWVLILCLVLSELEGETFPSGGIIVVHQIRNWDKGRERETEKVELGLP
jgi:hypothetical protein